MDHEYVCLDHTHDVSSTDDHFTENPTSDSNVGSEKKLGIHKVLSSCSPSSSGSTKGININKFDIDIDNLDVEISWDDFIVGERIGQGIVDRI